MPFSCLVGQNTLIFRNETLSSVGFITTNEPEESRCGSGAGVVVKGEPGSAFRAWSEGERGSESGTEDTDERRPEPEAVVWDGRRSEPGAVVRSGRGVLAEESESMGASGESARLESGSSGEGSSLRRFFPIMGKKQAKRRNRHSEKTCLV